MTTKSTRHEPLRIWHERTLEALRKFAGLSRDFFVGAPALPPTQTLALIQPSIDLLLVCEAPDIRDQLARWLRPSLEPRLSENATDTVDRLVDRRPDVVWVVFGNQISASLALARELRSMQADAYEAPSWIAGFGASAHSEQIARDAGIFDDILRQPVSQAACIDALRRTLQRLPVQTHGPWIQKSTEEALPGFLASRRKLAQSIRHALEQGSNIGASKSAHTLAGSPGLHNFEEGVAACRYIEHNHATASTVELMAHADRVVDLLAQIEVR